MHFPEYPMACPATRRARGFVTIFVILLYVPPFKAAVLRVRAALGDALRGLFTRRA